jgi:hypothetical protein
LAKYECILRPKDALTIWERVFQTNPVEYEVWLEGITCVSRLDLTPELLVKIRDFYKRASKTVTDWPQKIFSEWLWFERVYGSYEEFISAQSFIDITQSKLAVQYVEQQKLAEAQAKVAKRKDKRKRAEFESTTDSAAPEAKKPKYEQHVNTDKLIAHVGNIPWKNDDASPMSPESMEKLLRDAFSKCGTILSVKLAKKTNGNLKGYGFVEFSDSSGRMYRFSFLFLYFRTLMNSF